MTLRTIVCEFACLAVCATLALAQTTTQTFRQTGNLAGASTAITGANYQANVNVSPGVIPGNNQEIYLVNWSVTVYGGGVVPPPVCVVPPAPPPPSPDMTATSVNGFVVASAVQRSASGVLTLDLDIGKLQQASITSIHCLSGVCTPMPPPGTFPLKGTFTPVTSGPGTFYSSANGNRSTLNIDPICRYVYSFSGSQTDSSAKFVGQIGTITVADIGIGSNAQLHVQKGQLTSTSTCTPPSI